MSWPSSAQRFVSLSQFLCSFIRRKQILYWIDYKLLQPNQSKQESRALGTSISVLLSTKYCISIMLRLPQPDTDIIISVHCRVWTQLTDIQLPFIRCPDRQQMWELNRLLCLLPPPLEIKTQNFLSLYFPLGGTTVNPLDIVDMLPCGF